MDEWVCVCECVWLYGCMYQSNGLGRSIGMHFQVFCCLEWKLEYDVSHLTYEATSRMWSRNEEKKSYFFFRKNCRRRYDVCVCCVALLSFSSHVGCGELWFEVRKAGRPSLLVGSGVRKQICDSCLRLDYITTQPQIEFCFWADALVGFIFSSWSSIAHSTQDQRQIWWCISIWASAVYERRVTDWNVQ